MCFYKSLTRLFLLPSFSRCLEVNEGKREKEGKWDFLAVQLRKNNIPHVCIHNNKISLCALRSGKKWEIREKSMKWGRGGEREKKKGKKSQTVKSHLLRNGMQNSNITGPSFINLWVQFDWYSELFPMVMCIFLIHYQPKEEKSQHYNTTKLFYYSWISLLLQPSPNWSFCSFFSYYFNKS